jgi:hypothetical protein
MRDRTRESKGREKSRKEGHLFLEVRLVTCEGNGISASLKIWSNKQTSRCPPVDRELPRSLPPRCPAISSSQNPPLTLFQKIVQTHHIQTIR